MLRPTAIAFALYVFLPTASRASDTPAGSVHAAVVARKLEDSNLKGYGKTLALYRDLATDGGVLVGFDVALGGVPPVERVAAIRPIYRAGNVVRTGYPAGRFISDEVTRTVRLIARESYVVEGIILSGDHQLEGLALRFARIEDGLLNATDTYESDWLGSKKTFQRETLQGRGRLVVGLFGRVEGDSVLALGATFVNLPRSPSSPVDSAMSSTTQSPELEATAATASKKAGFNWMTVIVFGAVTVSIGLVSRFILRRPPNASKAVLQRPKSPARSRTVLSDQFDLDRLVDTKLPSELALYLQSEIDSLAR